MNEIERKQKLWIESKPQTPNLYEAFEAGWKAAQEATSAENRKGSSLRGRVIVQFRTLFSNELANENPKFSSQVAWPCLELDDGTLVYAGKKLPDGLHGPARLLGVQGDQKVMFTASHATIAKKV